jgi:hypothetical protein
MTRTPRYLVPLALCTVGTVLSSAAQAQWYYTPSVPAMPPPLYPYKPQPGQPYAIEVAPNTYVIQRPSQPTHAWPYVGPATRPLRREASAPPAPKFDRQPAPADPALIDELRKRKIKREVIHTKKIVREKPIVIETTRVVDDPPRVVERYHYVDDPPLPPASPPRRHAGKRDNDAPPPAGGKRVIQAEAEVTILGPDRMIIRLTRKGGDANALAVPLPGMTDEK